ncbi:methionyl-tRNA formyltransferase [Nonlabens xiamenensis]|uniref:methionyl-tRNA formyltransferase n=1 Tax=Nonlabens xiamenensis TaxID=2341043 RepID=UPI000F611B9F|nr:methionyl-tRNA formyltransferase [Nonlabens xiamenensis]
MSKSLKIAFFGTPEFATGVLQELHHSRHEVVVVITAPDKPAGRGRRIHESDVKQYAVQNEIPVLQPTNLKSEDFVAELKTFGADLQVIVAFRMLPKIVWSLPPMGTFNLHASLLPQYRGAAPINWAIINGESKTGVTTFFIDEKIDTGAIIQQREIPIEKDENVGSLYKKLMELGAKLSLETVDAIADGQVETISQQEHQNLQPAPKLNPTNTTLDFSLTAREVDAMVRGLYPYPVAKACLINGERTQVKIHKTKVVEKKHAMSPGSIVVEDRKIMVACATNLIEIEEIQLPNKKRMSVKDLLNGYSINAEARFDVG